MLIGEPMKDDCKVFRRFLKFNAEFTPSPTTLLDVIH